MTSRRGLVLSVSTPKHVVTSATGDNDHRERMAEIERLVWATTPMLQVVAYNTPKLEAMQEWLADVDNRGHTLYDQRQQRATELASNIYATREATRRNARAVRVHALRLPPNLRASLLPRFGLDYSRSTGDSDDELDEQWSAIVEMLGDECPF